jgi:iron complex outermembrane receptor protein
MVTRHTLTAICGVFLWLVMTSGASAQAPRPLEDDELDEFGIERLLQPGKEAAKGKVKEESLLDQLVITASKKAQTIAEAPAVISVITARQIRDAGYRTVAEALEQIPGLIVDSDHVLFNVGVRGIMGGLRNGSRHIKLLIDGQPVGFRPDATNFLGSELIPIDAIARIEVVRGPGSALYGRNAFLGIINVVTKRGTEGGENSARAGIGMIKEGASAGGEVLLVNRVKNLSFTLAGSFARFDRSGLGVPADSPFYTDFAGRSSQSDTALPFSIFAGLAYDFGRGGITRLQGGLQNLDAYGEFLDYGALTHGTRIHLRNWYAQLAHSLTIGRFGATLFAGYQGGGPASDHLIQPAVSGQASSQQIKWQLGQHAVDLGLEGTVSLFSNSSILAGFEYSHDSERMRQNIFVSPALNAELAGPDPGSRSFRELGAYLQILFGELGPVQLSGNLRYDWHNIYGSNFNYRAVAIYRPIPEISIKALSGSSYRPATPEQLYATPVRPGDVIGALMSSPQVDLRAQTATSHELSLSYTRAFFGAELNGYYTSVKDRIEYLLVDGNLQPNNSADSQTGGFEASLSGGVDRIFKRLNVRGTASVAYQHTSIAVADAQAAILSPRQKQLLEINEIYPPWMVKWSLNFALPRYHVNLHARMNIYGARYDSQLNQALGRAFIDSPIREVGVSYPLHIVLSSLDLKLWGQRETLFQLAINDVLDSGGAQPGFGGILVPSLGRRFMFTARQAF